MPVGNNHDAITQTATLPHGYRATFTWSEAAGFAVAWEPDVPRIRSPRAQRKFRDAYNAARPDLGHRRPNRGCAPGIEALRTALGEGGIQHSLNTFGVQPAWPAGFPCLMAYDPALRSRMSG